MKKVGKRMVVARPPGYVPQERFEEGSAVVTGGVAAAISLLSPFWAILASGLAPFVANRLNDLYAARLARAMEGLREHQVDLGSALVDGPNASLKADTFRDYVSAVLETSSEEKVLFLLHLAEFGLKTSVRIEVLFAKRVIRTIARVDELEMIVLAALSRKDRALRGVSISSIMETAQISDSNILRSGLAVLQSEGLILADPLESDLYRVSDYGESVLSKLREAMKQRPTE